MIDTHAHLNYSPLYDEVEAVLDRAELAKVSTIVIPGTNLETSRLGLRLHKAFPKKVWAMAGVHPNDWTEWNEATKNDFRQLVDQEKPVAIGEVGLDYYLVDPEELERLQATQKVLFQDMLDIAGEYTLPIVIHTRESFADSYAQLRAENPQTPVLIHCFTGDLEQAKAWLELGYFFSVNGILTYKKSEALREVIKQIPLDRIMLETDSPFLSPEGFRGEVCEPARVKQVAECLAELTGTDVSTIDSITTDTAKLFFNLP